MSKDSKQRTPPHILRVRDWNVTTLFGMLHVQWLFQLVLQYVSLCMSVFCNVWVCVGMGFLMCGCVYVWVFWQLCVCFGNMCTCIYCVLYCLYCVFICLVYVYLFLFLLIKGLLPPSEKLLRKIIIIIIIYLSWSWATCWPLPVSRIQKSLQGSTMIASASWEAVFHYPG